MARRSRPRVPRGDRSSVRAVLRRAPSDTPGDRALGAGGAHTRRKPGAGAALPGARTSRRADERDGARRPGRVQVAPVVELRDRKSTRLNSSHGYISYAVFCLKKKKKNGKLRQP